ncbi:MAG: rhodanese-like domain-containing protein [Gammaproteobacteria bacterium]|nr:rhodanese-like domain-containing protein [Gammaproteobacteria bacterium]MDH3766963.1 rhodanese-like domain-containing protein [Gammaproteobacteria bacterium]
MDQLLQFTANHPLLVTAAVVTGSLLVFNEFRTAGQGQFLVSPDQAVRLMNKGALVIDLRSPQDYLAGHLSGAKNLLLSDFDKQLESFKKYRGKPVIAYDEKGLTTPRAITTLQKAEFEHVFSLRGGILAWREEHMPVEKGQS